VFELNHRNGQKLKG